MTTKRINGGHKVTPAPKIVEKLTRRTEDELKSAETGIGPAYVLHIKGHGEKNEKRPHENHFHPESLYSRFIKK